MSLWMCISCELDVHLLRTAAAKSKTKSCPSLVPRKEEERTVDGDAAGGVGLAVLVGRLEAVAPGVAAVRPQHRQCRHLCGRVVLHLVLTRRLLDLLPVLEPAGRFVPRQNSIPLYVECFELDKTCKTSFSAIAGKFLF